MVYIPFPSVDSAGVMSDLCIVQYTFRFGEHDVKICPHGNSRRRSEPYIRTQPSTLKRVKEERHVATQLQKRL